MKGEIENDEYTLGFVSAVRFYFGTGMGTDSGMAANDLRYSFSSLTSVSDENEADVSNGRQLVVVSVRGSVTILDWLMDLLTQFHVALRDCVFLNYKTFYNNYQNISQHPLKISTGALQV